MMEELLEYRKQLMDRLPAAAKEVQRTAKPAPSAAEPAFGAARFMCCQSRQTRRAAECTALVERTGMALAVHYHGRRGEMLRKER